MSVLLAVKMDLAMEAELGVKLFVRSTRGMCLTDEGWDFVQRAQAILDEVKDMEDMFAVKPEDCVRLRISVTRSYQIHRCVMDFVNSYSHKPQFRVSVKETNPFEVLEDVHTREAEMGVLHCFGAQEAYFLNRFYSIKSIMKKNFCWPCRQTIRWHPERISQKTCWKISCW